MFLFVPPTLILDGNHMRHLAQGEDGSLRTRTGRSILNWLVLVLMEEKRGVWAVCAIMNMLHGGLLRTHDLFCGCRYFLLWNMLLYLKILY